MKKQSILGLMLRLSIPILLFQLLGYYLLALDPHKKIDYYLTDQWQIHEGIPSNTVLSITQTPDGYLWIGTKMGLVRFDGMGFELIRFDDREEVYTQEIRHLMVDKVGRLWIGSFSALTLCDLSSYRFHTFIPDDGITVDGVRRIMNDSKGNIWISFTSSYINRFINGQFIAFNESHGLLGKKINTILEDRQGSLLFASRESGIFSYKDETFIKYPLPGLENHTTITMHEDPNGNLWIGTTTGLLRIIRIRGKRNKKYTTSHGLTNDIITCILEDSEGILWIGTSKGLNRVKIKKDGSVSFESLLTTFSINYLFEDREKSLWVATDNSGLLRLKDSKFIPYAPFGHIESQPLSLYQDRLGDLWIGTHSGKLLRCQGSDVVEMITIPGLEGTGIAAITEDEKGNLWLGTTGKGVVKKKQDGYVTFTTSEGLADNLVTSIFKDSRNNLWFSTFDGVSVMRFESGLIETFNSSNGLSGQVVHNVSEDNARRIWIAADRGITVLKNGAGIFKKKDIIHYLSGISVNGIYEDPDLDSAIGPVFWIATNGSGLKRLSLQDGGITSYTAAQGMTSNFIFQFLEDSRGDFWLMSNSGILRVLKSELNRLAAGSIDYVNSISYGLSDGMKSLEFDNEFSTNSVLKTNDGAFLFITKKGITSVNPANIRLNKTPPPVVIEKVLFEDRPVTLKPSAEPLSFIGVKELRFYFTAPTFLSPDKTKFKYRLVGESNDWVFLPPGAQRAAYYRDLSPGTYTFNVTACNAEGVWNPTGAVVTFILKPNFYQTFVFKLAFVLLFLVLSILSYLYIKRKSTFVSQSKGKKVKYKSTSLNPDFTQECITKLTYLMEVKKAFCDADITLQSLAEKMSIASYQLSQLLNEEMNRNFADFINWHRVEEAKRILSTPRGARRKISSVAIDVGFNTMAAFYKVFKKYTGTTPTEYKKKITNRK
jgi:ligand-binding sensor domain-containing protein/AraC-like DNA-binding protein